MAFDAQTNSLRYKTTKRTSEPDRLLTPEPGPSITRLLTAMHDSDNQDKLRLNCVENSVGTLLSGSDVRHFQVFANVLALPQF